MPKMLLKVEGRGNGIMTNITNLEDVAKALRVPPAYPLKFFSVELGAVSNIKTGAYIINGKHDIGTMEKTLDKYVPQPLIYC